MKARGWIFLVAALLPALLSAPASRVDAAGRAGVSPPSQTASVARRDHPPHTLAGADSGPNQLPFAPLPSGLAAVDTAGNSNFYLTEDVALSQPLVISGNAGRAGCAVIVNLCLNGHRLTLAPESPGRCVVAVTDGAVLNLCDCDPQGRGGIDAGAPGRWGVFVANGTFRQYGGDVTAPDGDAVFTEELSR